MMAMVVMIVMMVMMMMMRGEGGEERREREKKRRVRAENDDDDVEVGSGNGFVIHPQGSAQGTGSHDAPQCVCDWIRSDIHQSVHYWISAILAIPVELLVLVLAP